MRTTHFYVYLYKVYTYIVYYVYLSLYILYIKCFCVIKNKHLPTILKIFCSTSLYILQFTGLHGHTLSFLHAHAHCTIYSIYFLLYYTTQLQCKISFKFMFSFSFFHFWWISSKNSKLYSNCRHAFLCSL